MKTVRQSGPATVQYRDNVANRRACHLARAADPVTDRDHARGLLRKVMDRPFEEKFSQFRNGFVKLPHVHVSRVPPGEFNQTLLQRALYSRPRLTILPPEFSGPNL